MQPHQTVRANLDLMFAASEQPAEPQHRTDQPPTVNAFYAAFLHSGWTRRFSALRLSVGLCRSSITRSFLPYITRERCISQASSPVETTNAGIYVPAAFCGCGKERNKSTWFRDFENWPRLIFVLVKTNLLLHKFTRFYSSPFAVTRKIARDN